MMRELCEQVAGGYDKPVCRVAGLQLNSSQRGVLVSQLPSGKPAVVFRAGQAGSERTQFQECSGVPKMGRDRSWRVEP